MRTHNPPKLALNIRDNAEIQNANVGVENSSQGGTITLAGSFGSFKLIFKEMSLLPPDQCKPKSYSPYKPVQQSTD